MGSGRAQTSTKGQILHSANEIKMLFVYLSWDSDEVQSSFSVISHSNKPTKLMKKAPLQIIMQYITMSALDKRVCQEPITITTSGINTRDISKCKNQTQGRGGDSLCIIYILGQMRVFDLWG